MALNTQPYKGTRDFYPEDMRLRRYIFDKWRQVCESFGYEEYDGPILEPLELYKSKTSDEIVNEQSYSFTDRGDRQVIMRPEMTPTVSRMVAARRQELGYPLRLFSIPNCFRYERPQKGRLREFWQLNADIFGVEGIEADIEIIQLADAIMKAFGAKPGSYEIRVNSRKMLEIKIKSSKPKKSVSEVIAFLDKKNKMNQDEFYKGLQDYVEDDVSMKEWLISTTLGDVSQEEYDFIDKLKKLGIDSVKIDPSISRGFDYYTDIVFEVFDTNPDNNRSMFGGGRYDGLVGQFGVEPLPTVGFGMGDITLQNFLKANDLILKLKNSTDLALLTIGNVANEANKIAAELRAKGLNVSIDSTDKKLDKKIKSAVKQDVEYVLFVGESEIKSNNYSLKNLKTGKEKSITTEQISLYLKKAEN